MGYTDNKNVERNFYPRAGKISLMAAVTHRQEDKIVNKKSFKSKPNTKHSDQPYLQMLK